MPRFNFKQWTWISVGAFCVSFWIVIIALVLAYCAPVRAEEKEPTHLFYEWTAEDGTLIDFRLYFDQFDKSDLSKGMIATGTEVSTGRIANGRWDFTNRTYLIDLNDGVKWYGYEFFKDKFKAEY